MKRSEYKTVWRLWAEKKGLVLPDNLDANPNVQRGVRLEPKARKAFVIIRGTHVSIIDTVRIRR